MKIFWILIVFISLVSLTGCSTSLKDSSSSSSSQSSSDIIKSDGIYLSQDGAAKLTVNGNLRILKLTGTNYQIGYNYGYLLAGEIIRLLNSYVYWHAGDVGYTFAHATNDQQHINWETPYLEELKGMLAGIEACLSEDKRMITITGQASRPVCLDDLKIANTFADWACSSFSIWGSGTTDGKALIFRNLDYFCDPGFIIKQSHLILAVSPSTGKKWMTATFCGMTGVISGMNEDGISAVMQNTISFSSTGVNGIIPRTIALRKLLENLSGTSMPSDAENILEACPAYIGNNLLLNFGTTGRSDDQIACVLEYDGRTTHPDGKVTLRLPSDNATLPTNSSYDQRLNYMNGIINVNHYLKRTNVVVDYPHSCLRYQEVRQNLSNAMLDGDVTLEEGRLIMQGVGGYGTIHTTVFKPDTKWMRIYLAATNQGAFDCSYYDYYFNDLFQ